MKLQVIGLLTAVAALIKADRGNQQQTQAALYDLDKAQAALGTAVPVDVEILTAIDDVRQAAAFAQMPGHVSGGSAPVITGQQAPQNNGEPTHEAPRPGTGGRPVPIKQPAQQ